jgi:hypothetical protein
MGQGEGQERPQLTEDREKSPAQLRAEIEDIRHDLGDTAAALAAKTDVKTRARAKAEGLKRSATAKKDALLSNRGSSPASGSSPRSEGQAGLSRRASSAVTAVRGTATQNPVPTAALGALIGGFVLGRLTRRNR